MELLTQETRRMPNHRIRSGPAARRAPAPAVGTLAATAEHGAGAGPEGPHRPAQRPGRQRRGGGERATVDQRRRRFLRAGCAGLLDEPRPGTPRKVSDEAVERVVVRTRESLPRGATHWSPRSMARASGLSP